MNRAYPTQLKYTQEHLWLAVDGLDVVVGLTPYVWEELGEIVFLQLPKVGEVVDVEDILVTLESTKTVSDITSPLRGRITEVNTQAEIKQLGQDPFARDWLVKIHMEDEHLEGFLTAQGYQQYCRIG